MAKASKLPSGAWRCRVTKTIDGKKITKSFTVHPRECGDDSRKAKALAELNARDWLFNAEYEENYITVGKALDMYIEDKRKVLSQSTIADYVNMPKHFEEIKDLEAAAVDSKTIQSVINDMAIKNLSPKTIKNRIGFLISALTYAGIDKRFHLRMPKKISPELLPPEPTEFHRLLSMADDEEKLMIILAGLYTLRRGEIGGLCGEDILRDMNSIYVHTSRVKDEHRKWVRRQMPKNLNSVRVIQIEPQIMKMIPDVAPDEYVIKMNPDEMTHHFGKLRKKACVNCRLHDLRKYAASIRSEIMPSKYVEADGGWKKDSAVMRTIYDKPFKESRKEYSKKFNEKILEDYGKDLFG